MTDYSELQIECQGLLKKINAAILRKDWRAAIGLAMQLDDAAIKLADDFFRRKEAESPLSPQEVKQQYAPPQIMDDYELTEQTADKC